MKHRLGEERLLTSYLLGEASELEQTLIETNYFRDPQFYELLLAVEEELISDYFNGLLSAQEWRQFEQHFLKSARRQQKCEAVGKMLTCMSQLPKLPDNPPAHKPGTARPALKARRARQVYLT